MPPRTPLPRRAADSFAEFIREETNGGKLLIAATALALLWANVAADSYHAVRDAQLAIGPPWLHLDLSVEQWIADGLLALFFFVAGMEVKRELVVGQLADRRAAALPLIAAGGGMLVPALVAIAASGGAAADGGAWAIPVATDIAFALGVLALVGSALPAGVRVLLLSMAVIDDLAAIALIAVLFTSGLAPAWLAGGMLAAGAYALAHRARVDHPALLWAIAIAAWICIHASGVHATVAGILLGLLTPVRLRDGEEQSAAERYEHRLHPISAGIAVPLFALFVAGIPLAALAGVPSDAVAVGAFLGLAVGKLAGVLGGSWLAVRLRIGTLPDGVGWADVLPVAMLAGIGYTVSLLVVQLAIGDAAGRERAAAAVLAASVVAALGALALLRARARAHAAAETPAGGL